MKALMLDMDSGRFADGGHGLFENLFELGGAGNLVEMDDTQGLGVSEHGPIVLGRRVVQLFEAIVLRQVFDMGGDDPDQTADGLARTAAVGQKVILEAMGNPPARFRVRVDQDGNALDPGRTLHTFFLLVLDACGREIGSHWSS